MAVVYVLSGLLVVGFIIGIMFICHYNKKKKEEEEKANQQE